MKRNRQKPFFITFFDGIIIAGVLVVIGTLAFFIYSSTGGTLRVHIRSADEDIYVELDSEKAITVHGPIGETVIRIHDKKVEVLASDCLTKICVNSGTIEKEHEWIACLPNQVLIRIEGNAREEFDAESY